MDFVAGSVGGASSILFSHPLDTIKIRVQTDTSYKSTIDCIVKTWSREGPRAFFRGMSFPLFSASLYNACVFEIYKRASARLCECKYGSAEHPPSYVDIAVASMAAGAVSVTVGTPIDLIKIRLQVQTDTTGSSGSAPRLTKTSSASGSFKLPSSVETKLLTSEPSRAICTSVVRGQVSGHGLPGRVVYSGPVACFVDIVKTQGFAGLYRGASAMLIRDIPGYALYFVPYEFSMRQASAYNPNPSKSQQACYVVFSGGFAGLVSWGVMHPVDTIKSRLQADTNRVKYSGLTDCFRKTIAADGPKSLFRGIFVNALRGIPQSAALFGGYELAKSFLENDTVRGD